MINEEPKDLRYNYVKTNFLSKTNKFNNFN